MNTATGLHARTTVYPDRATWLAARGGGLGASEAAQLLGLSPWGGPWDVVAAKRTGDVSDDPDELADPDEGRTADDPLVRGQMLEPVVLAMLEHSTGVKAIPSGEWFGGAPGSVTISRHAEHPWLAASFDALTPDGEPVEAKTDASRSGWKWAPSGTVIRPADPDVETLIPVHYLVQVLVQLAVSGAPRAYVPVFLGSFRFRWLLVERDEAHERQLLRALADAWTRYVVNGEDPDIDASAACVAAMRARYRGTDDGIRQATEDEARHVLALAARKHADALADEARAHLLASMQGATCLLLPGSPPRGVRRNRASSLTTFGF